MPGLYSDTVDYRRYCQSRLKQRASITNKAPQSSTDEPTSTDQARRRGQKQIDMSGREQFGQQIAAILKSHEDSTAASKGNSSKGSTADQGGELSRSKSRLGKKKGALKGQREARQLCDEPEAIALGASFGAKNGEALPK